MKMLSRYLLFTVLLVLTGCSERELTFDRKYPDITKIEELREKRQLEIEEEIRNLPKTIMEKKLKPRSIVIKGEYAKDDIMFLDASQYCWDFDYLDCERINPIHPDDIMHFYLPTFNIKAQRLIKVSANTNANNFPVPVRIEAYIYDQNRNLNLYQTIDSTSNTFDFTSPSEPGVYNVLFKAFYQWEIDGISYHPVQVYVR